MIHSSLDHSLSAHRRRSTPLPHPAALHTPATLHAPAIPLPRPTTLCHAPPPAPPLRRMSTPFPRALRGSPRPSVARRGSPWPAVALRGSPWPSVALCGSPWLYVALHGPPWLSVALRGSLCLSVVLRGSVAPCGYPWLAVARSLPRRAPATALAQPLPHAPATPRLIEKLDFEQNYPLFSVRGCAALLLFF